MFLTEILFSKIPYTNSFDRLNYAVEIYNPTATSVNLSNYDLTLTNNSGSLTTITLSGILAPYKCHVVSNVSCDVSLSTVSDALTATLDLELNISLQLRKNSIVIDELGEGVSSTGNNPSFDLAQFTADPQGYLNNFDVNLDDYQNIDVRRGMLVNAGEPDFDAGTNLLGNWYYSFNTDLTDIGSFNGPCDPLATQKLGFKTVLKQFNDQNWGSDQLILKHNLITTVDIKYTISNYSLTIGAANKDAQFEFYTSSPTDLVSIDSFTPGGIANFNQNIVPGILGWPVAYSGNRCLDVTITSPNNDFTVDPSCPTHKLCASGNLPNAIINQSKMINIFSFDVENQIITIETSEMLTAKIYNINGQMIKEIYLGKGRDKISVSEFPKGLYIFKTSNSKNNTETRKFIK